MTKTPYSASYWQMTYEIQPRAAMTLAMEFAVTGLIEPLREFVAYLKTRSDLDLDLFESKFNIPFNFKTRSGGELPVSMLDIFKEAVIRNSESNSRAGDASYYNSVISEPQKQLFAEVMEMLAPVGIQFKYAKDVCESVNSMDLGNMLEHAGVHLNKKVLLEILDQASETWFISAGSVAKLALKHGISAESFYKDQNISEFCRFYKDQKYLTEIDGADHSYDWFRDYAQAIIQTDSGWKNWQNAVNLANEYCKTCSEGNSDWTDDVNQMVCDLYMASSNKAKAHEIREYTRLHPDISMDSIRYLCKSQCSDVMARVLGNEVIDELMDSPKAFEVMTMLFSPGHWTGKRSMSQRADMLEFLDQAAPALKKPFLNEISDTPRQQKYTSAIDVIALNENIYPKYGKKITDDDVSAVVSMMLLRGYEISTGLNPAVNDFEGVDSESRRHSLQTVLRAHRAKNSADQILAEIGHTSSLKM